MITLFLIRHAESRANVENVLAGQLDFPLSDKGKSDAVDLARGFVRKFSIDALWCSPLLRAQQTAAPFLTLCDTPFRLDERIMEQNMGRFSGMSYVQAEADPRYQKDRAARWDWVPDDGGESYSMIASRIRSFLKDLRRICDIEGLQRVLLVTHAVALRLFRGELEQTLPAYPEAIAANGELWISELGPEGVPVAVESHFLIADSPRHKA